MVYLVAFRFGVFRLRTRQLWRLAATAIFACAVMVGSLYLLRRHTVDLAEEGLAERR